ncbi:MULTISPECIES: caspase family protein [unclassified Bradyrhizobium]|uniref:caspase family protein n=1 Tax=unclassified Bradyrhizobium TaxID=2631580 RepID=UPI001BA7A651|nr:MULTISPECIES: caspase family protein [unclassified Bradyrhizobium]MBR1227092.1 caspase family protein [Bradyrhizobium sp. AUGA SZCCT0176]MBR1296518.1 caspase family protein [Bradyrhizobium sp. AUGA SZCCT0042]
MFRSGSLKLHRWVLAAAALLAVCQPAFAEKRVALVLGNSAYRNVPQLANPVNDSAKIAATLKEAGFDVVDSRRDLPAAETRRALRDFADRARDADIAVVYYAGHGIEVDGSNYLIPVDAKLERDTDVYDEALSLDRVLIAIEPAKKLRLVILDACRDNPFAKTMKRTVASRAIGQGLAKVEPSSPNVLIAYSAKAGFTAADGDGQNSPFTAALSRHIATPGLDVRRAFGFVRDEVLKTTGNRQEPFVYGSLGGDDVPLVPAPAKPAPAAAAPAPAPALSAQAEARRDYELALQLGNKNALDAFLKQYPDGFYASLAKLQLDKIAAEEIRIAATEKARLAEQERARLVAEGAQRSEQSKAEADVRATEQARIAAEKAKQIAQDQAAAAEQKRLAVDAPASAKEAVKEKAVNLAALPPASAPADITKSVQAELRRVGCLTGAADGDWNAASQRSLTLFNRYAGTRLDAKVASVDTLDAIKLKPSRVCPLVCEHGFRADGDRCSKITCAQGSVLNDDNECEKRRGNKPVAKRDTDDRPERPVRERPRPEVSAPRPQASGRASGQVVCDQAGCRSVTAGCRLEYKTFAQGGPYPSGGNVEVCR